VGDYPITCVQGTLSAANYDFPAGNFVAGTLHVNPAHLTVTADNKTKTYDGSAFTAFTATITGFVNGDNSSVASGTPSFSGTAVGAVNAGSYTITPAVGTLTATNYDFTVFCSGTLTIQQATPTVTVTDPMPTYDGNPHSATATAKGVNNATVTGSFSFTYDGSGTAPMNAKTSYAVVATFISTDPNYIGAAGNGSLTIKQAVSTTTVTFESAPYTYRGMAFTATAAVTGAGSLNQAVSVVYTADCVNVTVANGCTATANFSGDTNHTGSSDTKSITIIPASSTTVVTFEPAPYTYRGTAFTATAAVTGVGGLNQPVSVVYNGDCTNVTSPNGCTATANFPGDTNHTSSTDGKSITITQASSTTVVTFESGPYTYRGTAFTASAAVTGVGGLSQVVSVIYSGDCTNVTNATGCTATATFTGDTNHTGSTDSKSITITQAGSTTTVVFETGPYTYRGTAFTATASVTGVGGLGKAVSIVYSGDCLNVSIANGCTATATFAGDTNHTGSSDTKSITITQAGSTTTVTFESAPYTYRGTAFTASAVVTGVGSLNHSVSVVYGGDCTNVTTPNGCTATATFPGDANHTGSTDTKTITITQAPTTTTVSGGTFTYNGLSHPATVLVTGAGGLNLAPPPVYSGACSAAPVNVPDIPCTASYSYAGDTNHTGSTGSTTITITKANQTITWNVPATMTYGAALSSTQLNATVVGVSGGTAPGALTYNPAAGTVLSPGSNSMTVTAAATPNYNAATKTVTILVQYQGVGTICDGDAGHQILQPINADGTSVFKGTSTSPAKFRVCDANGASIGTAGVVSSFSIYQIVGGTVTNIVNEDVASTTPDMAFRWDSTGQQWIFNINNKSYQSNQTYFFRITLNDGTVINFDYGLR
jgi:uncharacterized protein (AIM24 family)